MTKKIPSLYFKGIVNRRFFIQRSQEGEKVAKFSWNCSAFAKLKKFFFRIIITVLVDLRTLLGNVEKIWRRIFALRSSRYYNVLMSANNSYPYPVPFIRLTRNLSEEARPLFQIDARGDIRPRLFTMAGGDSNEAATEFARRRTMIDIVRNVIERRRNSQPIIQVWFRGKFFT